MADSRDGSKESREITNNSEGSGVDMTEEPSVEDETKDKFGAIKILREAIDKKYKLTEHLGKGSYGMVCKGVCLNTGKEVALKIMNTG